MEKDTIDRMTTRIEPNWRLGTVQTSSFRYHEHHFLEYMGSVDNCRLNDFLDSIPLSYFDEYFRHRDERYVDDVRIEEKVWYLLGYSLQTELSAKNRVLASTRDMMISPDYKERFKAEYIQLKNRFDGLKKMLDAWDDKKLSFIPPCPRIYYNEQVTAMEQYLRVLERRAKLEDIDLSDIQ